MKIHAFKFSFFTLHNWNSAVGSERNVCFTLRCGNVNSIHRLETSGRVRNGGSFCSVNAPLPAPISYVMGGFLRETRSVTFQLRAGMLR